MNFTIIMLILVGHWIADFIYQDNEDAQNKWNSPTHLFSHIYDYGKVLGLFLLMFGTFLSASTDLIVFLFIWWIINVLLHWLTDYFTSKWTHSLWEKKDVHNFFVVIGLDQLIHYFCLFGTWFLLQ